VECRKFGEVRHIAVDPDSDGHIYLKFDSIKAAQRAIDGLNGRYFAKRQVFFF
jgi:RNA-binding protein 39